MDRATTSAWLRRHDGDRRARTLRSAIEETQRLTHTVSALHGGHHSDQPRTQLVLADAASTHRTLQTAWHETARQIWSAAVARDVPAQFRAECYSQLFHLLDTVRHTVSDLYSVATNATYRTHNRVDRALRDIHAVCAGSESFRWIQFEAARVLAGEEPTNPAF